MTRAQTIKKYVLFLNELKRLCDTGESINIARLTTSLKTSKSLHLHAIKLGYFERGDIENGFNLKCNLVTKFEPCHARKLAEAVCLYNSQKTSKQNILTDNRLFAENRPIIKVIKKYTNIPPSIDEVRARLIERGITKYDACTEEQDYLRVRDKDQRDEQIIALHLAGKGINEIARQMNVAGSTISRIVKKRKMKNWDASITYWNSTKYVAPASKDMTIFTDQELIGELKRRGYSGLLEVKREITF